MNCCRETTKVGVPARHASKARWAGHRATAECWIRGVLEQYVAGSDTRGRQEGRPYNSRSLRSAQSRKRVPSFVVVASDS